MVDQRRRGSKEVEQQPKEFLRRVSSQLLMKSYNAEGELMNTSSIESLSLEDDLLVNTSRVFGLDPGNDALLYGQGSGVWPLPGYDVEPKEQSTYGLMDRCLGADYPMDGATMVAERIPSRYLHGVYPPGPEGFITSPFAVGTDMVYGMPLDECKPDIKYPVVGPEHSMSGLSVDVKGEALEAHTVDSILRGHAAVHSEFLSLEKNSEIHEPRNVPVDISALAKNQVAQRVAGRSKGVTMCLRTLLRQLLAGTGWIMDSSISKDHATHLIRQLVGPQLDSQLVIQLSPQTAETMSSEDKEAHYSRILGELVTQYVGCQVTMQEAQELIKRDKGPYHLTQEFIDMLNGRQWPPQMISEKDLRRFGCYRQGEASKRNRHD